MGSKAVDIRFMTLSKLHVVHVRECAVQQTLQGALCQGVTCGSMVPAVKACAKPAAQQMRPLRGSTAQIRTLWQMCVPV
jgi:hypothetical protein